MNLFSKLFNQKEKAQTTKSYDLIKNGEQFQHLMQTSTEKPFIIFKHSERCSISRWVWKQFERDYNMTEDIATLHLLDVVSDRDISQAVAAALQIMHESPQVLVIFQKKCIYNASHERIQFDEVLRVIKSIE